jgi:hypothetical protein
MLFMCSSFKKKLQKWYQFRRISSVCINIFLFIKHKQYEPEQSTKVCQSLQCKSLVGKKAVQSQGKFVTPCTMTCLLLIFVWSQKLTSSYRILFYYISCFLSTPRCTLEPSSTLEKYCAAVHLKLSMAVLTLLYLTRISLIHIFSEITNRHLPPMPVTPSWSLKTFQENTKIVSN